MESQRLTPLALLMVVAIGALLAFWSLSLGTDRASAEAADRARYVATANQICAGVNARIAEVPHPTTLAEVAAADEKLIPLYLSQAEQIRAVPRPATDMTRVTDMLHYLDRAVADLRRSGAAAQSNDLSSAIKAYLLSRSHANEAQKAANDFGLTECARPV